MSLRCITQVGSLGELPPPCPSCGTAVGPLAVWRVYFYSMSLWSLAPNPHWQGSLSSFCPLAGRKTKAQKEKGDASGQLVCGGRESWAVLKPEPRLAWSPFPILQLMHSRQPAHPRATGLWLFMGGWCSIHRGQSLLCLTQSPWPTDPACHPLSPPHQALSHSLRPHKSSQGRLGN